MVRMRCRMIRIGVPRIAARATHWSTSCHAASILGCGSSSQYVRVRLFRAYFNTRNLTATEHTCAPVHLHLSKLFCDVDRFAFLHARVPACPRHSTRPERRGGTHAPSPRPP